MDDAPQRPERVDENDERYRLIVENAAEAIFIAQEGVIKFANPVAKSIIGYSDEMLASSPFTELIHPDDRAMVLDRYRKRIEGQSAPAVYPFRVIDRGGATKWVELRTVAVPWEGKPATLNFLADITERRQMEEALVESEKRYRHISETITDFVYSCRKPPAGDYIITWIAGAVEQITGYSAEEIKAFGCWKHIVHADSLATFTENILDLAHGMTSDCELRIVRQDGGVRWVQAFSRCTVEEQGEATHVLYGACKDITGRKQAEEELKQAAERLRKSLAGTIQAMSLTVETRDPYTAGHQRRVSSLARSIAQEMMLPAETTDNIRMAASIHDIGKMSVPAEILSKPGILKDMERSLIQVHPQAGYEILKDVDLPYPIAEIVLQHHERIDGSGYPQGLTKEQMLLEARILAVADVVEAIASHRPYRPTLGIRAALEEIERSKGALYDSDVVEACLRLFREKGFELE